MQEKKLWQEGAVVTAEDVAASSKPLIDEYFMGECTQEGGRLIYALPNGKRFEIAVSENRSSSKV